MWGYHRPLLINAMASEMVSFLMSEILSIYFNMID